MAFSPKTHKQLLDPLTLTSGLLGVHKPLLLCVEDGEHEQRQSTVNMHTVDLLTRKPFAHTDSADALWFDIMPTAHHAQVSKQERAPPEVRSDVVLAAIETGGLEMT